MERINGSGITDMGVAVHTLVALLNSVYIEMDGAERNAMLTCAGQEEGPRFLAKMLRVALGCPKARLKKLTREMKSDILACRENAEDYTAEEGASVMPDTLAGSVERDEKKETGPDKTDEIATFKADGAVERRSAMGRIAAKGALNYDQERQRYNPAFAFEKSTLGRDREYAISRAELFKVYQSDSKFREQAREGVWAFLDGLVCLNNSEFICRKGDGHQLTPSANRRVNQCCLRFIRTFEEDSPRNRVDWSAFKEREMYPFIRNCERIREANEQTKADILARVPDTFTGALDYMTRLGLAGKMNDATLGIASTLGADVIREYRTNPNRAYDLEDLVMICVGLKLPPWLSEVLLERANLHVKRAGKQSVYGFILDCLYLDEGKTVRSFLSPAENRPAMAEEEEAPYLIPA